jgi:CheY-like chemotaxis protein
MSSADRLSKADERFTSVLVVEDDPVIRSQISGYLRLQGFKVFEAATADDALLLLKRRRGIDCVFSDVQMPGRYDGFELAHWILANRPGIPILLTSGEFSSKDLDPVLSTALRVLPKPYRGQVVEAGIAALVDQYRIEKRGASSPSI